MDSITFLMKVWELQCQAGDYVAVSAKGNGWQDTMIAWGPNTRMDLARWLKQTSTRNQYFCPLPFHGPFDPKKGPSRDKTKVRGSRFLWSDIDEGNWEKCKPSILWESSPGRFAGLWMLPKFVGPDIAAEGSRKMAYMIGADRGGWDLTQVLRIPGTKNLKYPDEPTVTLVHFTQDILKTLPVSPMEKWRSKIPRKILGIIEGPAEQGKRSDMLWYLEHELCDLGIPLKDVIAILKESDWNKYRGRADENERFGVEMEKIRVDRADKKAETRIESRHLEVVEYSQLLASQATNPGWMVKDWWMRQSHGIIAGEPKSFKSTLCMDLIYSVAAGTPFLGEYEVHFSGPVLMIQNENADWIMKDRVEKLSFARGNVGKVKAGNGNALNIQWAKQVPMFFVNQQGFMLDDAADKEALEELIADLKPAAIVLDPLYLMFTGDVNSAKDLAPVLQWCLYVKQKYKCSVILIHHYGKGTEGRGGQRMLGSTTLHGWIESAWYLQVQEPNGDNAIVTMEREFRGAGIYKRIDVELEMGAAGDPHYATKISEHIDGGSSGGDEADVIAVMQASIDDMSKTSIAKKSGMSRDKIDRLLESLQRAGQVYRHGERYGLTERKT